MQAIRTIRSRTAVLPYTNIDTDQIIPARFLRTTHRAGLGAQLFADWRYAPDGTPRSEFPLNQPAAQGCRILVAGRNFGCGSSREHAPWALEDFGFQAIIAPSFADIFYSNCTKIGLLPAILDEEHCRAVAEAGEARIDVDDQTVTCAAGVFEFDVEPDVKHRLLHGLDDVGLTLQRAD